MKPAFTLLLALAACTDGAPPHPSFQVHVLPILAANCVRCHGAPPIGGASDHARLDTYDRLRADAWVTTPCEPGFVCGASLQAVSIASRVTRDEGDPGVMPPRFVLDDVQVETLVRWTEQGAARGAPRPGNRAPTLVVDAVTAVEARLVLAASVDDDDGDLVAGELYVRLGATEQFVATIRSGHQEVSWRVADVPRGSHPLFARLDDGAGFITVELGTVEVP